MSLRLLELVLLSALLFACSAPRSGPVPEAGTVPGAGSETRISGEGAAELAVSPARTVPPAPAELTKKEFNEGAFAQIQQQNWAEAAELARRAIAIDANDPQAHFNLGLALYRSERYAEARAPLEKATALNRSQVEPGWFLALTLERLGESEAATALMRELRERFPSDPDLVSALERLEGVVWKVPASGHRLFLGDVMLVIPTDGQPGEVRDAAGRALWSFTAAGPLIKSVPDPRGDRVLLAMENARLQLVDLTARRAPVITGVSDLPDPGGKGGWFGLSGDLLYAGGDQWTGTAAGGGRYAHTVWQAYRLIPDGEQLVARPLGDATLGEQQVQVLPDGRTALLRLAHEPNTQVLVDGRLVRTLIDGEHLTDRGDTVLRFGKDRLIRLETLDGKVLRERRVPEPYTDASLLPQSDGHWFLLTGPGPGFALLREQELVFRRESGEILAATAEYLLVRDEDRIRALDLKGKLLATYPGVRGEMSPDGRWLYEWAPSGLRAWRFP